MRQEKYRVGKTKTGEDAITILSKEKGIIISTSDGAFKIIQRGTDEESTFTVVEVEENPDKISDSPLTPEEKKQTIESYKNEIRAIRNDPTLKRNLATSKVNSGNKFQWMLETIDDHLKKDKPENLVSALDILMKLVNDDAPSFRHLGNTLLFYRRLEDMKKQLNALGSSPVTEAISTVEIKEKLNNLKNYLPNAPETIWQFEYFLSGRLGKKILPEGFFMAASLALYDLQKGVSGFYPYEKIKGPLVGLQPVIYELLSDWIPIIAKAVAPDPLAEKVQDEWNEIHDIKQKQAQYNDPKDIRRPDENSTKTGKELAGKFGPIRFMWPDIDTLRQSLGDRDAFVFLKQCCVVLLAQ